MNIRQNPPPSDNPAEYSGRYTDMKWPVDVPKKPLEDLTPEQRADILPRLKSWGSWLNAWRPRHAGFQLRDISVPFIHISVCE